MAFNQKEVLEANKQAISLALSLTEKPNATQIQILKKFKGWGGLKCLLYPMDIEWNKLTNISKVDLAMEQDVRAFYDFIALHYPFDEDRKQIIDNIKGAILNSFYTPNEIPDAIFEKLYENNQEVFSFLDPSAGNGVYIENFLKYYPNCERVVAIEKDPLTAMVLTAIYKDQENVKVYNKGFEEVIFDEKFDVIASNIPFGKTKVYYPKYDDKITDKIHNFFFYRAQELLNEGGYLSFITSSGVFNSKENQLIRETLAERGEVQNLITLPNNTFDSAGTQVTAHLFNFIKDTKLKDNIIADVIQDDEGITLNRYIFKYFQNSFLADPKIDTNPYGEKEYNYKMPLQDCIEEIKNRVYLPKLQIQKPLVIGKEELQFITKYPQNRLQAITSKQEEMEFVQRPIPEGMQNFRVVGAILGKYKGQLRPFAVVSKKEEDDYLLELCVKGDVFNTQFKDFEKGDIFHPKFKKFLDELSTLFENNQIKIEIDFRRTVEGKKFSDYVAKTYKNPLLTQFYVTRQEINVAYHRSLQVDDMCFTENKNPAIVKQVGTFENDTTYYKLEEIEVTSEERNYLRKFFGVYHYFNVLSNVIKSTEEKDKAQILTEEGEVLQQKKIGKAVEQLNKRYDDFIASYGYFNEQKRTRFQKQLDKYFPILKALENPTGNLKDLFTMTYDKSDIFRYEYVFSTKEKLSIRQSLIKSLRDKKGVDLEYIAKLSNQTPSEIVSQSTNLIVFNPLQKKYELREIFLSGDLYKKIEAVQNLPEGEEKETTLRLLNEAMPLKIPYFSIRKQIGSRWIPTHFVNDFVNEFYESKFQIFSDEEGDNFLVGIGKEDKGKRYFEHQTINGRYIRTEDIIKSAYDDVYPIITYTIEHSDGTKETKTDEQATNFCKREITRLQRAFDNYMLNLPQKDQNYLEEMYNRMFNNTTHLTFDTDLLDFSDMQLSKMNISQMYPHQKEAVWKMLKNNGGVVDHEVGLGKTLTMIALSQSLKEMGVCKKPMIIGLKANIGEIAHTYKKLYPNAKILFATEKDYTKKEREVFLNRVKTNDWDCVIMSHQQFGEIPQNASIELEIAQEELEHLEKNLQEAKGLEISKKQLSQLENSKKSLMSKILKVQEEIKQHKNDNVMNFQQLGVDHIIVDESHFFKNLSFQTRHTRVAGLGNPKGSQMASNLLTAIRTIQKITPSGEGGASLFSGTPISNSLTELFLLHKYLTPKQLEDRKCKNFDSWASVFAVKSTEFEVNMVNQIVPKERFRYFVNLPDLAKMYTDMASVQLGGNLIDRPEKNEYLLENYQTPLQQRFYHKLARFLKTKDPSPLNLETPINMDSKNQALSYVAMNLAFKASLDMRLINSSYPDDPNSKINTLVRDLIDKYHKFDEQKGTQIVFCDMSVSKEKLSFQEMDDNYKNNKFTSIYDDIKYKLLCAGIPENEIAFVQDYATNQKKEILSEKMNKGEIRFLLGSTQNAGTGLNVQQRLIRIAHLSIPWKPSEIIQRNGRGFRRGNWIAKEYNDNKVEISFSGTANTLDNYKMNINSIKEKFINQIREESNPNIREMDEGEMDENTGMNLAEFQAQLSGDTTLLDKHRLEKKIKELEAEKVFVVTQKNINQQEIKESENRIKELETIIDIIQKDFDKFQNNIQYDEKGTRINKPTYKELDEEASDEEIQKFLKEKWEIVSKMQENISVEIGELYGFKLYMKNGFWDIVGFVQNPENPQISYMSRAGKINFEGENTAKNFYINCLGDIERRLKSNLKEKEGILEKLEQAKTKILPKWEKDEILSKLYEEKEFLDQKIRSNSNNQEVLPYEIKVIDGVSHTIPIVRDLETLENALLKDLIGKEKVNNSIYTAPEVVDILDKLEETETISIKTQYFDEEKGKEYVKFVISDADALYCKYRDLIKNKQLSNNEIIKENQVKRKL